MLRAEQIESLRGIVQYVRGHRYFAVLVIALLFVAAIWVFAETADEVMEGETQTFDERAILALRRADDPSMPLGPTWLHVAGRDVTALGGTLVLVALTLAVAGYLLIVRMIHAMWLVLVATFGGMLLSTGLKLLFERERPDVVPHLSIVHSPSFPSGHAMLSAVVYLTLGVLLARLVPHRRAKVYFIALALLTSFAVGISRVYMGVHYPTDVLAGWTAGLAWALLCWTVARWLQMRGAVERDIDQPGGRQAAAKTASSGSS